MPKDQPESDQNLPKEKAPAQPTGVATVLPEKEKMGPACQFLQKMLQQDSRRVTLDNMPYDLALMLLPTHLGLRYDPVSLPIYSTVILSHMYGLIMAIQACQEERRAEAMGFALPDSSTFFAKQLNEAEQVEKSLEIEKKLQEAKTTQSGSSPSTCSIL